jgi:cobalt/nickel transport system permease protein
LPAQCKLLGTLIFIVAIVMTPRDAFVAFALYAGLLVLAARVAGVPLPFVTRRLVVAAPFLLFVISLPFVGGGPRVDVAGLSLSAEGSWAAWNIAIKATIALSATIVLVATTTTADLLHGLEHLRMPSSFTAIARFMIRYADVITGELERMKHARLSRGYSPAFLWQARAVALSAGALFIRSFERGERVHKAMLSRGFIGTMPVATQHAAEPADWSTALAIPLVSVLVSLFFIVS